MKKYQNLFFALIPAFLLLFYLPLDRPFFSNYSFETFIDNWIPLLTVFTIPYISYYFLLIFSFFYVLKKNQSRVVKQISGALTVAILLAYFFYFFFQNSIQRPEIISQNFFDDLYIFINSNVPPYNAFPSLHVAISIILGYGFYLLKSSFRKAIYFWITLIIFSTVLTKQHYFLDIIGGILLAVLAIRMVRLLKI